ncbi:hypothetical protein D3C83_77260 [compost metagenome]
METGEDVPSTGYAAPSELGGMRDAMATLGVGEDPAEVASAVEFILEGMHLSKRLNKDAFGRGAVYRGR